MIIPIGDSPNPHFTPWVNYGLMTANIAVFLLLLPDMNIHTDLHGAALREYFDALRLERGADPQQLQALLQTVSRYDLIVWEHGYRPADPGLMDALSAMFLHGGWSHLAGNMLFLWIYGDNVEHHLGRFKYLMFYLLAGLFAAFGDGLLRPDSAIPSVGASGAISGVLAAYFLWFPQNRVRLFVFLFPIYMGKVEVAARWVLGAYVLFDNVMPILFSAASGNVSYGAHLGGFAAGLVLAWLWAQGLDRPESEIRDYRKFSGGGNDLVVMFQEAMGRGAFRHAAGIYLRMARTVSEERVDADDKLDLAAGLESHGMIRAAFNVLERVIAEHPHEHVGGEARTSAARLLLEMKLPVEAFQLLRDAIDMPMDSRTRKEAVELMAAIRSNLRVVPPGGWW